MDPRTSVVDTVMNRESILLESVPTDLFVGGRWRGASDGGTLNVADPATGTTLSTIASATADDARAAMDAAADAFPTWSRTPARQRGEILRRAFDLLTERADDFALLMTLEMGKPLAESRGEVKYGGEFLRWFSEEAARIRGAYGANPEGTGRTIVSQHAVGPCYLITPWNFPLAMATRKIAPALAGWVHRRHQAGLAHPAHHARLRRVAGGGRGAGGSRERADHGIVR
ncbi:hypothetical protein GCM10025876_14240 [Demequina litorisediminis]|uniref:Aldehyde dehydrogenase domain-containing protein n=1 Tax=Demequina litorisediminis TaxID=1849022 RepID=A0ABQ6ICY2_9MICO|nr:hypothetical protein GCM10025876_14240 [Demequina litorisediminis]